MNDNPDTTFRDLSFLLRQQIDALVGLQYALTAMHMTLCRLNPQYEETCKGVLETLTSGKTGPPNQKLKDQIESFQAFSQKVLAALMQKH